MVTTTFPLLENEAVESENKDEVVIEGQVAVWIDQGAIHLKLLSNSMDPIELTEDGAKRLADTLRNLAAEIEAADAV
jgi:hypothetical protein